MKFKRIVAGEYDFKGGYISKDESEPNLWWVHFEDSNIQQDAFSYKEAKILATRAMEDTNK